MRRRSRYSDARLKHSRSRPDSSPLDARHQRSDEERSIGGSERRLPDDFCPICRPHHRLSEDYCVMYGPEHRLWGLASSIRGPEHRLSEPGPRTGAPKRRLSERDFGISERQSVILNLFCCLPRPHLETRCSYSGFTASHSDIGPRHLHYHDGCWDLHDRVHRLSELERDQSSFEFDTSGSDSDIGGSVFHSSDRDSHIPGEASD